MKFYSTLICFFFCFNSFSQNEIPKTFKLSSINFSMGSTLDMYRKMDLNSMKDISTNTEIFSHNLEGYTPNLWRESGGFLINLDASFSKFNPITKTYRKDRDFRVGISYSEREPAITYDKRAEDENGMITFSETIMYCNVQNEINLSGAYLIKTGGDKKRIFKLYAGLGANLGATFNDKMIVFWDENHTQYGADGSYINSESNNLEYTEVKAKSALFLRAYIPAGIEINLWRIRLGAEATFGSGVHQTIKGGTYLIPTTFSFGLKAGFTF